MIATTEELIASSAPFLAQSSKYTLALARRGDQWRNGIMFFGRAPNGWINEFTPAQAANATDRAKIARDAMDCRTANICRSDEHMVTGEPCDDCMHWVHHLRWLQSNSGRKRRGRTQSAFFWRAVRDVVHAYQGQPVGEHFAHCVAWSNLYKLAPASGGNPSWKIMLAQRAACAKLIRLELEEFRPRHVVFFTEHLPRELDHPRDPWFEPFCHDLPGVRSEPTGDLVVSTIGKLKGDSFATAFVVAPHPLGFHLGARQTLRIRPLGVRVAEYLHAAERL